MNTTDQTRPALRTHLGRVSRALLTGSVLLGGGAPAQTAATQATPAPDPAVQAMLAQAQAGGLYTLPGSVWEVCDRLSKAGLEERGLGITARRALEHVFYDAARAQYLSVVEGERTVIRVTSSLPAGREWIWTE